MSFKKKLVIAPVIILSSALLLAGCSGTASTPPAETSSQSSASPEAKKPAPTPEVTVDTPVETTEPTIGGEMADPNGGKVIPMDNAALRETTEKENESTTYVFEGDATSVEALKPQFEAEGFIWNDSKGDNTYVLAASVNSNLIIEVLPNGTYTYTVFHGE